MLDLQERRPLLECLHPPEGFEMDAAIGTTFSLDLVSLLVAPIAFTMFSLEETNDGKPRLDSTVLLESLRRNARRMVLFCQAGQTYLPAESSPLFAYLEDLVVEVDPGSGGVFHPKIWVLRFKSPAGTVRYRLLCASRNLTFDRCWDSVVCLEGTLTDRTLAYSQNRPLGDLLARLPQLATGRPIPTGINELVAQVQSEVRRVKFDTPEPFDSHSFWAGGVGGRGGGPLAERCDRALVVSPFCSAGTLEKIVDGKGEHILVSQPLTLNCLPTRIWDTFQRVAILSDAADEEETPEAQESMTTLLTGLHAKIFVFDQGWKATIWTGSANATTSAFERNVEFLVGLSGKRADCGVDAVFGPRQGATTIADLSIDFPQPTTPEPEPEPSPLEEVKVLITRAGFRVTVEAGEDGQAFLLKLAVPTGCPRTDTSLEVRCWPVSLRASQAHSLTPSAEVLTFGPVGLEGITSFFAFEAALHGGPEAVRFVLNLPIAGIPKDRSERLLRSILKDAQGFARFIGLLLASEYDPVTSPPDLPGSAEGQGLSRGLAPDSLFEKLVRTLHRNPARLDAVERLVEDLAKDPENRSLLPPGFEMIWAPVLEARKRMR